MGVLVCLCLSHFGWLKAIDVLKSFPLSSSLILGSNTASSHGCSHAETRDPFFLLNLPSMFWFSLHRISPLSLNNSLYCLCLLPKCLSRHSSRLVQCPFLWPWQKHSCPVHFRPQLYKSFSWPVVLTMPIIFEPLQWFLFPLGHQAYCDSLNFQSPSWLTPNMSLFIPYQNINAQHQSAPDASFNWSICEISQQASFVHSPLLPLRLEKSLHVHS